MSTSLGQNRESLVSGVAAGIAAWLVGYVLTYVFTSGSIRNTLIGQFLQNSDVGSIPQAVGLVFYNAHFVETIVNAGFFGSSAVSFIGGDNGFTPVLYAIPVVLLVLAGLLVAVRSNTHDAVSGSKAGVTVAAGYLVLSVIGVFAMQMGSGSPSARPDLATGILLTGIIYPALFGAVGGAIGGELLDE
ncbi:MAG: transporter [Halobacteriales archaeon]|nr:transporter [Halobacteriales archaeon]